MARDKKQPQAVEEQEEMTVVILRYRGTSASLQKGFDTVSQALAALGHGPVVQHRQLQAPVSPARSEELDGEHNNGKQGPALDADADFEESGVSEARQHTGNAPHKYSAPNLTAVST